MLGTLHWAGSWCGQWGTGAWASPGALGATPVGSGRGLRPGKTPSRWSVRGPGAWDQGTRTARSPLPPEVPQLRPMSLRLQETPLESWDEWLGGDLGQGSRDADLRGNCRQGPLGSRFGGVGPWCPPMSTEGGSESHGRSPPGWRQPHRTPPPPLPEAGHGAWAGGGLRQGEPPAQLS